MADNKKPMKKPLFEEQPDEEAHSGDAFGAFDNKLYEGAKGHLLLQLQKSYRGDERFKMDERFTNDIESKKVTNSMKGIMDSKDINLLDKVEKKKKRIREKNRDEDEIVAEKEKDKAFQILSEIVPQSEVFLKPTGDKKRFNGGTNGVFMMKRFDPTKKECKDMLLPLADEKKKMEEEVKKNVIKIESGVKPTVKPKPIITTADAPQVEKKKLLKIDSNWKNISSKKNEDKGLFFLDFAALNSEDGREQTKQTKVEPIQEPINDNIEEKQPKKKNKRIRESIQPLEVVEEEVNKNPADDAVIEEGGENSTKKRMTKQERRQKRLAEIQKSKEDKLKKKKKEEKFLRKQKSKYMGAYGLDESKAEEYLRLQDLIKKTKNKSIIH